jgi:hypothetical protein
MTSWSRPELSQTYSWIASHSQAPDILASPFYVRDGFYTSRPSLPLPDSAKPETFAILLKKSQARLILWQEHLDAGLSIPRSAETFAKLRRIRGHLRNRKLFWQVYENSGEGSRVYELK